MTDLEVSARRIRDAFDHDLGDYRAPAGLAERARLGGLRRARSRCLRRWACAAGVACAALGLAAALVLAARSSARPVHVRLAAWSVTTNPDGTVTFKLRKIAQPARLQHVLAEAGVPAMVRWGEICLAQGRHDLLSTQGFVKTSIRENTFPEKYQPESFFASLGGQRHTPWLDWSWTITPGKIPPGGRFVISAIPPDRVPANDIQSVWEFVHSSAPVACARLMKP